MSNISIMFIKNAFLVMAFYIINGFFVLAYGQSSVADGAPNKIDQQPEDVMHAAIENVMATMRDNEKLYRENPKEFQEIVNKIILPNFNLPHMAQLVMGNNWKNATDSQKNIFIKEFEVYLMRSYVNILYLYRYTKPEILGRTDSGDRTTLKLNAKDEAGKNTTLFLRLEKNNNQWRIFDINVEGVSLVVTSRGQFNDEISKKGIDGFLKSFSEQNKRAPTDDNKPTVH